MSALSSLGRRWLLLGPVVGLAMLGGIGCSRSAQDHLDRGVKYEAEGKLPEAVIEYRAAVQKDATNGRARQKLADAYEKRGDVGRALGEFIRAADLLPDDVEAQLAAGRRLLLVGRADEANGRAEKVLAKHPENADALVLRANALAGLSKLDDAVQLVEQAISLDPTSARYTNLGLLHLAKGKAAEAEQSFRKAVSVDPKSVAAHLALANFLWATGRTPDAEAALQTALTLAPDDLLTNRALATLYTASGRAAEAEPYYKKVAAKSTEPGAKLALADFYLSTQRHKEALAVLESLSAVKTSWGVARSRIAGVQYAMGDKATAHRTIDEVIAKEPSRSDARVIRARFLLAEGKTDKALTEVQEAVRVEPDDAVAQFLLGSILLAQRDLDAAALAFGEVLRLNPRATPAQVQLARVDLLRGSYANATQLAEQATRHEPGNAGAQLILVRSLVARGEIDRASSIAAALVQRYPSFAPFHSQLGVVKIQQRDYAGARAAFTRALALDATLLEGLSGLVALDLHEGRPEQARARVTQRLAEQPRDATLLVLAGKTWASTKDPAKAEEFYKRAIEVDPSMLEAYERLGRLYWSQQKLDEAVAEFTRLAQRQPKAVGPLTMVGLIRQAQGRLDEAEQSYRKVIDAEPRAAVASNNLAWIYANRKSDDRLDEALQLARAAKAQLPDHPAVNDTLGFVLLKKQLPALALPPLKQAVEKEPENAIYRYRLGLAYSLTGDAAPARRELEQALKLQSDFEGADEARKLLDTKH